eukprot:scaffold3715_cov37-Tisochrysis_lutea.AAC.1
MPTPPLARTCPPPPLFPHDPVLFLPPCSIHRFHSLRRGRPQTRSGHHCYPAQVLGSLTLICTRECRKHARGITAIQPKCRAASPVALIFVPASDE